MQRTAVLTGRELAVGTFGVLACAPLGERRDGVEVGVERRALEMGLDELDRGQPLRAKQGSRLDDRERGEVSGHRPSLPPSHGPPERRNEQRRGEAERDEHHAPEA